MDYFQFPKIFKRLVSAPTKSYSKIDVTVRRGLKRRIINRCSYKDLKTRGPHLDHLKVFLEIAYKPPSFLVQKVPVVAQKVLELVLDLRKGPAGVAGAAHSLLIHPNIGLYRAPVAPLAPHSL